MIISIDQSTSATKALLFDDDCKLLKQVGVPHKQHYPQPGWVEHDAEEIWQNTIKAMKEALCSLPEGKGTGDSLSVAITNQRETVVVWNRMTGKPVYNAVVWQCMRGQQICEDLKAKGFSEMVKEKSGLLIDPYFAGSGAKWILDNVDGARAMAESGALCFGTVDSWLVYKLTGGKVHATDFTNASRTMLFNVHTLDWDDELLEMLTIPRSMMPKALPCDAVYGEVCADVLAQLGCEATEVKIAGILGDSHGALSGQMCFAEGFGKATYGTGSSVMVNIGEKCAPAPEGLVTSVGFSALGKTFYAFEGNIHCTGATLNWLRDQLQLINGPQEVEAMATSVPDNGGVYFVPAFSGLGAPWWNADAKACISGMSFASTKAHVVRAALESIAYQVTDLIKTMTEKAGINLKEIRVDGGPTKNKFLMQMQSDLLQVPVVRSEVEDASAFGALVMNRFALGVWKTFDEAQEAWTALEATTPAHTPEDMAPAYAGWQRAVQSLL
ncbi:MAG: glycerol kinase GlpK [Bacteroidales bacterium]|nr:glycerol kinase GlpK [Bacteroidales bacterium]MCM1147098.1 glycerol kinase GlpK [Bacteroidales bacterium]MCM1205768.1 glycerol kinase GlpK [Bacillota bacterium]MCM1511159.1 glycerol kinase GlpK [Clostridium sp.]